MKLDSVIDRLSDQCPSLNLVGGGAEYAIAMTSLTTFPAAFALPSREIAAPPAWASMVIEQRVAGEFGVAIAVRNLGDKTGKAAVGTLHPVRIEVRNALLNWQPPGDEVEGPFDGCEFVGGEITAFANNILWWTDIFRTAFTIRSTS